MRAPTKGGRSPWGAIQDVKNYEIGAWSPVFGKVVEGLGFIGVPDDFPLGQLRAEAAKKAGVPRKDVRLRETHKLRAKWI